MSVTAASYRIRRGTRTSLVGAWLLIPLIGVLAALPFLVPAGIPDILVTLFILVIIATMWNLLAGYAGMISIGQQAYMGIGAYGLFAAATLWDVNPFIAVLFGVGIAAVLSIPLSFLVFRLSGGYFAIATWVVAEVVRQVVSRIPALSGAGIGTMTLPADRLGATPGWRSASVYWLALGAVVVVVAVTYLLMRARLGAGFTAIRDEPVAAASLGVRVTGSKRIAYVVAAAGCAVAGGILALTTLQVRPDSMFRIDFATWMIFMVVIGGIGTIEGPIVGAVLFFVLQQWLAPLGTWYLVILGVIAILVTLLLPRGLWGLVDQRGIRLFPVGYRVVAGAGASASTR